jgi:hypothetical protein
MMPRSLARRQPTVEVCEQAGRSPRTRLNQKGHSTLALGREGRELHVNQKATAVHDDGNIEAPTERRSVSPERR